MINLSKFAETLDYLIYEYNNNIEKLDAKTLAKRLNLADSTITRYLREERAPTVKILILLANFFKCTTDFLLGRENENYSETFKPCPPFSKQLTFILKHYNCTCYKLSKKANIHQSRIYDWKNGKRMPSVDNVIKIANYFNCTVDFVLGR